MAIKWRLAKLYLSFENHSNPSPVLIYYQQILGILHNSTSLPAFQNVREFLTPSKKALSGEVCILLDSTATQRSVIPENSAAEPGRGLRRLRASPVAPGFFFPEDLYLEAWENADDMGGNEKHAS